MEYIKEFIKNKESKGEKAIYRVNDNCGYTYYSDDYVMWLEQQLRIHDVSGSVCDNCGEGKPAVCAKCYEIESNFRESY